jgi:Tol biopolymer transport system component/DNA-binding SARP family transcriptional activator
MVVYPFWRRQCCQRQSPWNHRERTGDAIVLRFKTLGQVFLERDSTRVAGAAAQPRRLALLAILAAAGPRGVSRDRLLALLWTDTDEERARKGLNQALYALRQEIGSDEAITGTRDLVLAPELVHTDVADFRAAIAIGDMERAVAVYEGQFLDGFHLPGSAGFEPWMEAERIGFARDHASAVERLARRAEEQNDSAGAVDWWRKLASLDPLDGRTTLRLMEALVRAGDRVSALKQARIYEVLLSQELELPPDREVIALADRIRATEAGTAPAPAPNPISKPVVDAPAVPTVVAVQVAEPEPEPAPLIASLPVAGAASERPAPFAPVVAPFVAVPASVATPAMRAAPRHRWPTVRWIVGGVLALAAVGFVTTHEWSDAVAPTLGATRRITLDAGLEVDPVLAPDGRTLAYVAGAEGTMRIFVRRLDGGRAVPVSGDIAGDHRRPRWSPDGSRLLFQAGGGIWVVPALGGAPRPVVQALRDVGARALYPEWSPDGATVAWVRRDSIIARTVDGGDDRLIATLPEPHSLAWSPDGRWLAVVSGNEGFAYGAAASTMDIGFSSIGNIAPSSVWLAPAEGGTPVRVTSGDRLHTSPAWLAKDRLLFVSDRDGTRDLFVLPLRTSGEPDGAPRRLTTGLDAHTVSVQRDGRALAYSVFGQRSNVWALPIPAAGAVGTSGATPITTGPQIVEAMEVSPDGKWLAFDADGMGSQDIYRVPLGGGEPERVVESPTDDHRPTWSADGRSLLFYSFVDGVRRAFVAPAHGGAAHMLQSGEKDEQHTPVWSPDMRRVLFHRPVGSSGVDQIFELTRVGDASWSAPRQLTLRGGFGGRWSPDGAHLAYVAPRQVRLMGDGPNGEMTSRVLYDATDTTSGSANPVAIRWSPDGRTVYMKTFDARGEAALWALSVGGGAPRLLVRFDEPLRPTRRPEFATDGKRLYFTLAQSESDVWVMGIPSTR